MIPLPSEETYNLINYFKLNYINIQTEEKSNKIDDSKDNRIILKKSIIKNINVIMPKLKDYKFLNNEALKIIEKDNFKLNEL